MLSIVALPIATLHVSNYWIKIVSKYLLINKFNFYKYLIKNLLLATDWLDDWPGTEGEFPNNQTEVKNKHKCS